ASTAFENDWDSIRDLLLETALKLDQVYEQCLVFIQWWQQQYFLRELTRRTDAARASLQAAKELSFLSRKRPADALSVAPAESTDTPTHYSPTSTPVRGLRAVLPLQQRPESPAAKRLATVAVSPVSTVQPVDRQPAAVIPATTEFVEASSAAVSGQPAAVDTPIVKCAETSAAAVTSSDTSQLQNHQIKSFRDFKKSLAERAKRSGA
ncbi:MAG: hypothetical protein Q9203_007470, partial [Teloschistes exilis]